MSLLDVEASEESSWSLSHTWSDIPIPVGDDLPAQPTMLVWPDRGPIGNPSFPGRKTEPKPRSSVRSDLAPRASLLLVYTFIDWFNNDNWQLVDGWSILLSIDSIMTIEWFLRVVGKHGQAFEETMGLSFTVNNMTACTGGTDLIEYDQIATHFFIKYRASDTPSFSAE